MQIGYLVAFALICTASAQIFNSNATQLTIGTPVSSILTPQTRSTNSLIPDLYYVYIPENANLVNVTLSVPSNTPCTYTDIFVSPEGFSCPPSAFVSSAKFVCDHGSYNGYTSSSSVSIVAYAGSNNGPYPGARNIALVAGGFYYISVARELSGDYADACPYTIGVQVSSCPATNNSIAVGTGYASGISCNNYTAVDLTSNNTFTSNGTRVVYKLTLPQSTGNVMIQVAANDSYYVYGSGRYASDTSSYTTCYQSSSSGLVTLTCLGVQAGSFFFVIDSSGDAFTGTANITTLVCSSSQVGPYCNDTFFDLNNVIATGVPSNVTLGYNGRAYGYFDVNANYSGKFVFVTLGGSSGYLYYSRNGYPINTFAYSSSSIAFSPITLNNFAGGMYPRYYLLAECTTSTGCTFSIGVNGTVTTTTTTTTGSVSGTVTGSASTTASGSVTGSASTTASGSASTTATGSVITTQSATTARMTTARMTTGRASSTASVATTNGAAYLVPSMIIMAIVMALMF